MTTDYRDEVNIAVVFLDCKDLNETVAMVASKIDESTTRRLLEVVKRYRADDGQGAMFLLQRLEKEGVPDAALYIANFFEHGLAGIEKDVAKAIQIYERLAKDHHPEAIEALARLFFLGQEVDINYERAFHYYSILARVGDARAQFIIGDMYMRGLFVPQDTAAAEGWFMDAANGGNLYALINVGLLEIRHRRIIKGLAILGKAISLKLFLRIFSPSSDRLLRI